MNPTVFPKVAAGVTAALAVTLFYAAHAPVAAKAPVKTPKLTPAASISQGKGLIAQYRCNGCHGADLAGKQGFSPSLHQSASLKSYHQATFVRLLLTGVTDDGGHVRPPMPVYGAGAMHMRPGGMRPGGPGGPPPGGPGGPPPGGPGGPPPGGVRPGGMHMPPPMTAGQAASIYAYLHTLK